jgi:hypothetical protein
MLATNPRTAGDASHQRARTPRHEMALHGQGGCPGDTSGRLTYALNRGPAVARGMRSLAPSLTSGEVAELLEVPISTTNSRNEETLRSAGLL